MGLEDSLRKNQEAIERHNLDKKKKEENELEGTPNLVRFVSKV